MNIQSFFIQTFLIFTTFLFLSCTKSDEKEKDELTYQEKEIIFLKEFREKVREDWRVEKMVIAKRYLHESQYDSVVYNLGRIFINNIYNDPTNADKYNQLEAYFYINNEVIPFKSKLLGNFDINGVTGLVESDYYIPFPVPVNSDYFSEEYLFLDEYFFDDNYSMILSEDGKTWTWKGLNRFIREIVLVKNMNYYQ